MVQKAHNQEMSSIYSQRYLQKTDCHGQNSAVN